MKFEKTGRSDFNNTYSRQVSVSMLPSMFRSIKKVAERDGMSVNEFIRLSISERLKRHGKAK